MSDRPAICYETGLDEAFLVGTRSELASMARAILDALDSPGEPREYLGVRARSISHRLTEAMAQVVIDGILVVESRQDRRVLMDRILVNGGDPPIDWGVRMRRDDPDDGPEQGDSPR